MKHHAPAAQRHVAAPRRGPAPRLAAHALDASPRAAAQRRQIEAAFGTAVQRKPGAPDEELLQGKFSVAQRQGGPEEEAPLQGRFATAQRAGVDEEEPVQPKPVGAAPAPANRTGMPDGLKAGVEALSGIDMSDVRVHANSSQPAALDAHAYAQGSDIHLAPGQERHLPHEAWHVVQQRQGRVQPTLQMAGVAVNDDAALEAEADAMGAQALQRATDRSGAA